MSIVESDWPPSWSLDVSETGESTKCLWVGEMGLKAWGEGAEKNFLACRALHHPYPRAFCTLPSFARIKRPRWRPVGLNDRHLRSHGKIGDCVQSTRSSDFEITRAITPLIVLHSVQLLLLIIIMVIIIMIMIMIIIIMKKLY